MLMQRPVRKKDKFSFLQNGTGYCWRPPKMFESRESSSIVWKNGGTFLFYLSKIWAFVLGVLVESMYFCFVVSFSSEEGGTVECAKFIKHCCPYQWVVRIHLFKLCHLRHFSELKGRISKWSTTHCILTMSFTKHKHTNQSGHLLCAEQSFQKALLVPSKPCNIQDSLNQSKKLLLE